MLTLPVTIRYSERPVREPAAWFIAGRQPGRWLKALIAWRIPLSDVKLYVVPESREDRHPRGVLVVPPTGSVPRVSAICQAYGRVGARLYLPVGAVLVPEVDDGEVEAQLSDDAAAYVLHPVCGLVRFDSSNMLNISDLLAAPIQRHVAWDQALPGIGFNQRLVAVQPELTPDFSTLLDLGRDDIDSRTPSLENLPPAPDEPRVDPLARAKRAMVGGFAKVAQWFVKKVPKTSSKPTLVNKLEDWARRLSQNQQQDLDAIRNREIKRLLHLLEAEPDEGLRYALPLSGEPHRGVAPPSGRLSQRDTNFDLQRLGGGRPADVWNIEAAYRQRLTARYRELANREIQLGRHRRAAYILAKLLGDFGAAAATLAQGHHYREAASLYREKLNQPLEAARCLEKGGLITEAIAAYEDLADFERVGDLYAQIDQPDPAREAYRRAVARERSAKDHLKAARLLETKLNSADEALAELADGWPKSEQAGQCLKEEFLLLARLGRHVDAQRRLESLEPRRLTTNLAEQLIDQFATMATGYPEPQVRVIAADRTRVVVADRLRGASEASRRRMVAAVGRLVPADRLLTRDCQRFLQQPQQLPVALAQATRATVLKKCSIVSQFKLPADVAWKSFCSIGEVFFAAGYRDQDLVLIRGLWDGKIHQPSRKPRRVEPQLAGAPILLSYEQQAILRVHVLGGPARSSERRFPATDLFSERVTIKSHPGFSPSTIALVATSFGSTWIAQREADHIVLSAYSAADELQSTRALMPPSDNLEFQHAIPLPLHARSSNLYVGLGDQLVVLRPHDEQRISALPAFINTLSGSLVHSRPRIVATFDRGGAVCWDDYDAEHVEVFAMDLPEPQAVFTQRGWLAAVGGGECQVYGAQDRKLVLQAIGPNGAVNPIAVVATDHADQFAVCDADGSVSVLQIPLG